MKNIFYAALLEILFFSCRKLDITFRPRKYFATVQAHLKDSLSPGNFGSLDFAGEAVSSIDSLYIRVLRVPLFEKTWQKIFLW